MPVLNVQGLIDFKVKAIRDYHKACGVPRAEIDDSGGIDSAEMLLLLTRALGSENITAVYQGINSSQASLERARDVAKVAGVKLIECDWTQVVDKVVEQFGFRMYNAGYDFLEIKARMAADPTIMGSLRSTFRAPMGRFANRLLGNGIRHGTGNEDEDRWLRFYQKGGDGEVDTNPICMLSKGEVFQLGMALGVPKSILEARPSPDLWGDNEKAGGQTDESEIKAYLGIKDFPQPVYSYVDLETGKYKNVGLIERVSRFVDWQENEGNLFSIFDDEPGPDGDPLEVTLEQVEETGLFKGLTVEQTGRLLGAARHAEKISRHKYNPNIPVLGCREDLIAAGLLTNALPV
jgi:NAD+ synthetase